jgi:hypothetical protein
MTFFSSRTQKRLDNIERNTILILERLNIMATTIAQEDAELTVVEGIVSKLATDFTTALADLKAAVPVVDATPEFNRLVALAASLTTQDTAVTAADPGAPAAS